MHAEPITEEDASRLLNHTITASCRNLFYLVLMEKPMEFVLAADSVYVDSSLFLYYNVNQTF